MFATRFVSILGIVVAAGCLILGGKSWAAQPTTAEKALRDRWVDEHFPRQPSSAPSVSSSGKIPVPGLLVWTNLDRVLCNSLGAGKPLQVAGRKFEHGLYCHAPSRVQVFLTGPGKSLSAVVGIQDSDSQGGSVIFSVDLGEKRIYSSPVLHRGEAGVPLNVDLNGAKEFTLSVGTAGDGLSSDQSTWGNAKVILADGKEIRLGDLPLRDPLTLERSAAAPPFSFFYGNRHSDEFLPTWKFQEERSTSKLGKTIRVRTYTDPQTGLIVRCTVVEYADFPTVEWTLSFKNSGKDDTPILAGILPLDTRFERGENGEFLLHHFTGSPCTPTDYEPFETPLGPNAEKRINTAGGRPTNTNLPYFNLETGGGGVIAVISWAGQWAAQFTRDQGPGLRMTAGQEATSFRLHPGEEVRSPLALLLFYRGDWIRAQNVWRSWMLAHNVPRHNGKILQPFLFVCFGNFYDGLKTTAAGERQFLSRYLEEGIHPDYWNQDAGWYPCDWGWPKTGTWEVDKTRWPHGIREISDWLKTKGIKTITWFEPERIAGGTWLAEHHPEWCFGGAGGGLMKIGDPNFRQWITDRVDQLITSEGIDFYRQDFNIDPLYYWRGADAEDRQGIAEIRHVEGYFAYWDELVRRHPNLWIDTCASGGRRNDLETLRRAVPILRSDWVGDPQTPGADPADQQNHMYGISFWMPFNGTGYITDNQYLARSVMTAIHGIGVDPRRKDVDFNRVRKQQRQWREISPCYLGDYFPLTPYSKSLDAWTAWQFDLPDTGRGMVQAFRRQNCPQQSLTVKLRGLDPQSRYELRNLDEEGTRQATGRELMETGLTVTSAEKPAALIFTYRRL